MGTPRPAVRILMLVGAAVLICSPVSAKDDPKKFEAAIDAASERCKRVAAACFQGSQESAELYMEGKYCEMMELVDDKMNTKGCMVVTNGCTKGEYNKMKGAVCGATSMVVSLAVLVIGLVVSIFGK